LVLQFLLKGNYFAGINIFIEGLLQEMGYSIRLSTYTKLMGSFKRCYSIRLSTYTKLMGSFKRCYSIRLSTYTKILDNGRLNCHLIIDPYATGTSFGHDTAY